MLSRKIKDIAGQRFGRLNECTNKREEYAYRDGHRAGWMALTITQGREHSERPAGAEG